MIIFLKIASRYLKWIVLLIIVLLVIYALLSLIFSIIPVNRGVESGNDFDIYIKSNGVHLDIILPLRNEIKDWTNDVWIDSRIVHTASFISFGWGDKEFYLNTPEWSDLTLKTAIRAVFLKSPSALHIDYYTDLQTGDKCKMISINEEQYKMIVDFIENSFMKDIYENKIRIEGFQYDSFDCFYEAVNSYDLFFTCNTWTNKCLKESGLRACLWTPFDSGILYHYRKKNIDAKK